MKRSLVIPALDFKHEDIKHKIVKGLTTERQNLLDIGARNTGPFRSSVVNSLSSQPSVAISGVIPDTTNNTTLTEASPVIGSMLLNGKFKCSQRECVKKTFKRAAELRRHHNTVHSTQKPEFWCLISSCERSAASGTKPFSRKDKQGDHMRKMHNM